MNLYGNAGKHNITRRLLKGNTLHGLQGINISRRERDSLIHISNFSTYSLTTIYIYTDSLILIGLL